MRNAEPQTEPRLDTTTSLPIHPHRFSPEASDAAGAVLARQPRVWLERLLTDAESQKARLLALRIADAVFDTAPGHAEADPAELVLHRREALQARIDRHRGGPAWNGLVRQRAPLALIAGSWLDMVSQPATEPAVIVNRLSAHRLALKGDGVVTDSLEAARRRALEAAGIHLPALRAADFTHRSETRPLTAVHTAFYAALSLVSATRLPEVIGVHCAYFLLGVDDHVLGGEAAIPETDLLAVFDQYRLLCDGSATGEDDWNRLQRAVTTVLALEEEHLDMADEFASWIEHLSIDDKVAAIIARHMPFAGKQHRQVKVGGRLLTDWFADPVRTDLAAFLDALGSSRQVSPRADGTVRFMEAIKFGGPMFGIFDAEEAATFAEWVDAVNAGERCEITLSPNEAGDAAARRWHDRIAAGPAAERIVFEPSGGLDDRELFYRLVNVEQFPNVLPMARERAEQGLTEAEILFEHGGDGRYTDASWFEYTPKALLERAEAIYWRKLVEPYRRLEEVPGRDEVVFGQKLTAFGSMVDGAWAHRIGGLGRYDRRADGMLLGIYADEMGRGDVAKNHITLIRRVLESMGVRLPHIRSEQFKDQAELPDIYAFPIHQLSLALFPDSLYDEIVGYNLGIEMLGLGEMRLHEIQKLRRWGFDTVYEEAHLTIDNFSSGHARQSVDLVNVHLDDIARHSGEEEVRRRWRRVWRGYASFAYHLEVDLVNRLRAAPELSAELVI
ncbi:iron-containing redox enzyme family protein [Glycomyces sp. L485]|uniref:iron-containing redox enzyme family protein n=1 Tax=Glycomyces sp. L485 TaxID=2909235 RepID=UPI001F4A4D65|nr:iron-containing redox enzyme family protein [Glycomyces sp. L485]MCH7230949.1 iron-containing redox enzyme family protein [Glycomyces sp. L485]